MPIVYTYHKSRERNPTTTESKTESKFTSESATEGTSRTRIPISKPSWLTRFSARATQDERQQYGKQPPPPPPPRLETDASVIDFHKDESGQKMRRQTLTRKVWMVMNFLCCVAGAILLGIYAPKDACRSGRTIVPWILGHISGMFNSRRRFYEYVTNIFDRKGYRRRSVNHEDKFWHGRFGRPWTFVCCVVGAIILGIYAPKESCQSGRTIVSWIFGHVYGMFDQRFCLCECHKLCSERKVAMCRTRRHTLTRKVWVFIKICRYITGVVIPWTYVPKKLVNRQELLAYCHVFYSTKQACLNMSRAENDNGDDEQNTETNSDTGNLSDY